MQSFPVILVIEQPDDSRASIAFRRIGNWSDAIRENDQAVIVSVFVQVIHQQARLQSLR